LWPGSASFAQDGRHSQRLLIRFRTDPGRIARMLPPPLKAGESAEVWVEYLRIQLGESSAISPLGSEYLAASVRLAVEHESQAGWFEPIRWTTNEWLRLWEREHLGFNTKHGEIDLKVEGASVTASLNRRGFRLNRIATPRTDRTLGAEEIPQDRDTFAYRYALDADWREPLLQEPAGLWRIAANQQSDDGLARTCDLENTKFEWPHASALDPVCEFPALEVLGVSYEESPAVRPTDDSRKARYVTGIAAADFQPWGLVKHDRPTSAKRTWQPKGWQEEASAFRLAPDEIESYRSRKEMRIDQFDMLDIRLTTVEEQKIEILPSPCQAGPRPVLRVLVLRVEESDISPVPFSEAWLLAFCNAGTERGWYALSHISGVGGDITFGREVLGYPTKTGTIDLSLSFVEFAARCSRRGREFLSAQGGLRSIPMGTSLSQIPILGLRSVSAGPEGAPRGEIVLQPWYFQGRYYTVDRPSVEVTLPEPQEESGVFDPWFEFNPVRVASISVMMGGSMQRTPGRVIAATPDFQRHYRERCDGAIPGIDDPRTAAAPTFGVIREPVTRS
ncbi:MAG: acetoacetate decarboxylase family protein, partial [Acidobacteria bacterium]|nr:acetoacetate decarboxylase family protein [Acidobacteriota bacterium]